MRSTIRIIHKNADGLQTSIFPPRRTRAALHKTYLSRLVGVGRHDPLRIRLRRATATLALISLLLIEPFEIM